MRWNVLFVATALVGCTAISRAPERARALDPTPARREERGTPPPVPGKAPETPPNTAGLERESIPDPLPAFDGKPWKLPPAPQGLPRAPARCNALPRGAAKSAGCEDRPAAITRLREALGTSTLGDRDSRLAALEACEGFPPGFVRTLRADLDGDCAEQLAAPLLSSPPPGISSELMAALAGLAHAARFARAVTAMPEIRGTQATNIDRFLETQAKPWVEEQSLRLAKLEQWAEVPAPSYGNIVVQMADAKAWATLHRSSRNTHIPDEVKKRVEPRQQYYAGLDLLIASPAERALSVSTSAASAVTVQGDLGLRVNVWLRSLTLLPGAQRLRDLWQLVLPYPSVADPHPPEGIEGLLPAFYAGILVEARALEDPARLRQLVLFGLSPPHRRALRDAPLTRPQRELLGFYYLSMGLRTLDGGALDQAVHLLEPEAVDAGPPGLWLALSKAMRTGPKGFEGWLSKAAPRTDGRALRDLAPHAGDSLKAIVLLDGLLIELAGLHAGDPFPRGWNEALGALHVTRDDPIRPCIEDRLGWRGVHRVGRPECPFPWLP